VQGGPTRTFPATTYPTPITACPALTTASSVLYVKNEGLTHPVYGGNKVRKAERVVESVASGTAKRILTFGSAGSHHVLTMALFARERGLATAAVLTPQIATPHVEATLRASIGAGVQVYPASGKVHLPLAALAAYRRGDAIVPPGASTALGALATADAVAEVADDVRRGAIPEPDVIVVPLGSGGTCAGILAGLVQHRLRTQVVGVLVANNPFARLLVLRLARQALSLLGTAPGRELAARLTIDSRFIGAGYGAATPAADRATGVARDAIGLELDETYTSKAFAAALDLAALPWPTSPRKILYWHTLSAAPLAPLLEGAPRTDELPESVRKLLVPAP